MLSEVNLSKKIDKNEYKLKIKPLKTELEIFQRTIQKHKISVIILMEGWEAAEKVRLLRKLLNRLTQETLMFFLAQFLRK